MLLDIELCVPIFSFFPSHHILCKMPSNCLDSIADSEDWDMEFEHPTQRILDLRLLADRVKFTLDRVQEHPFHILKKVHQIV